MEMLESVARAIASACNLDPDAISPKAAEHGHQIPEWNFFLPAARAVLDTLRDPTPAMLEAARNAPRPMVYLDSQKAREDLDAKARWQAMVDVARGRANLNQMIYDAQQG